MNLRKAFSTIVLLFAIGLLPVDLLANIEAVYIVEKGSQLTSQQLDSFEKFLRNYFRTTPNYDPATQSKDVTKVRAIFSVEPDGTTMKIVEVHIEGIGLNVIYGYEDFVGLSDGVIEIFRTNIENVQPRYDEIDLVIKRENAGVIKIGKQAAKIEGAMQFEFDRPRKQYLFDEVVKRLAGEINGDFEFKTARHFEKMTGNVVYDGANYTLANLVVSYKGKNEKTCQDTLPAAEVYRILSADEGQRFPRQVWNDYIRNEELYAWDDFHAPEKWRLVFHLGKKDLVDFTLTGVSLEFALSDTVGAALAAANGHSQENALAENSATGGTNHYSPIKNKIADSTLYVLPIPMNEEFYDIFLNIESVCNYYSYQLTQSRFDMVESVEVRMEYRHDAATQSNKLEEIYVTANYRPAPGDVEAIHPRHRQWTNEEVVNEFKKGVTTSLWHRLFNDIEPNIWNVKDFGISGKHPDENLLVVSLTGVKSYFRLWNKPANINMEVGHESLNYPFVYAGGIGYHLIFNDLDSTPLLGWIASSVDLTYRSYGPLEYFIVHRLETLYPSTSAEGSTTLPKRLTVASNEITLTKKIYRFKKVGTIDISLGMQLGGNSDSEIAGFNEVPNGAYVGIKDRTQFGLQLHLARGIKYLSRKRFYLKNIGFDFARITEASPESYVTDGLYQPESYLQHTYFFLHATLANYKPHPKHKLYVDNFIVKCRLGLQGGVHSLMIDNLIRLSAKIDWETKVIFYDNLAYSTAFYTGPVFKLNF